MNNTNNLKSNNQFKVKRIKHLIIALALIATMVFVTVLFTGCFGNDPPPLSVFDIAVQNGFTGSESEFLDSLRGKSAFELARDNDMFSGTLEEWILSLNGGHLNPEELFALFREYNPNATIEDFVAAVMAPRQNIDPIELSIQYMLRSAVSVRAQFNLSGGQSRTGAGAGVLLDINRYTGVSYIITNYHVVQEFNASPRHSSNIRIAPFGREFFGGSGGSLDLSIRADFVGGSASRDIAVLRTHANDELSRSFYRPVDIANSNDIVIGEIVVAVGNPEGVGTSATRGILNVDSEYIMLERFDAASGSQAHRVMRIDAAINSGNSGGGLFNRHGQLIGIVNAKTVAEAIDNIGYAIPSNVAIGVANSIIRGERQNNMFVKYTIGISTEINSSRAILDNNNRVRIEEEVIVRSITTGSIFSSPVVPASGIVQVNDILLYATLGNRETIRLNRNFILSDELYWASPGMELILQVRRAGYPITLPPIIIQAGASRAI